jgi:hypothetical protein
VTRLKNGNMNEELNDILHKYSANLWNMNLIVCNRLYFCNNSIVSMWTQVERGRQ